MSPLAFVIILVKVIVVFVLLLGGVAYLTWMERKVMGHIQARHGPLRVGWHGLLQPIADGIKLLVKEDIIPAKANKVIYVLAPMIITITAFSSIAVIPFGREFHLLGETVKLRIADINIGILYLLALSSIGVYGIMLGGWASNNKYSLLGGLRSAAQSISYELPLALAIMGVVMSVGSLSLVDIVNAQGKLWFIVQQPLAFMIFLICGIAECNRCPFDLPEAESELVAGFHTEYSSMKFSLFFLAEYGSIIVMAGFITTLFLGGWQGPVLPGVVWFLIKVFIICFFFLWLRATFPRLRYDQLMKFCWKVLFPLALFNIMVMALWIALDLSIILASVMNILVAGAAFIYFNYSPYFES